MGGMDRMEALTKRMNANTGCTFNAMYPFAMPAKSKMTSNDTMMVESTNRMFSHAADLNTLVICQYSPSVGRGSVLAP